MVQRKNKMKNLKHSAVDQDAINRELRGNWIRTIIGILAMGGLAFAGLVLLGLNFTVATVILLFFSVLMPVFGWYNSANLVKKMMRCREPNLMDKDHARLVRLVDELYPLTGLKRKPEVLISPIPIPNAFATGRNPDNAFIAATEGLFMVGLEDREIKAILAHELAHVKSRDVAITSLVSVLGSMFAIVLAGAFPSMFNACFEMKSKREDLLDKLTNKVKREKKRFADPVTAVTGFFITLVVFYFVSIFAKLVTLFVSRSRESAADVLASQWTKDPCALATALQKIVDWMNRNKALIQFKILLGGMDQLLFVSLKEGEEGLEDDHEPKDAISRFKKWVSHLGDNHPPVEDRVKLLDELAGQACPRMSDIRNEEIERRRQAQARRRAEQAQARKPEAGAKPEAGDKPTGEVDGEGESDKK